MRVWKISEDATTVTLGFDVAGDAGYRFKLTDLVKVPHTWDPARNTLRVSKDHLPVTIEALGVVETGVYPPPPEPTFKWGFNSVDELSEDQHPREFDDAIELGCTLPRLNGSDFQANLARQKGFKEWISYIFQAHGHTQQEYRDVTLTYCDKYPEAIIELYNEPNLSGTDGGMTAAQVAEDHLYLYDVLKSEGVPNKMVLASVGNSESHIGDYVPLEWCQQLADRGCIPGKGFDYANYHAYGDAAYYHIWTPGPDGRSCQSVFGDPEFYLTEFGQALSGVDGSEQAQADSIREQMQAILAVPKCRGAHIYAIADEASGSGTQYGLRRINLTHRPAWDVFKQIAST